MTATATPLPLSVASPISQLIYETDGESFSVRNIGPDGIANSSNDVVEGPFSSTQEARAISVETIEQDDWKRDPKENWEIEL